MSNSIDQNLEINNPISNLSFHWMARFNDNSVIVQFNSNGEEHRFKEVKDRFNELQYFYLMKTDGKQWFRVDLRNGLIEFNQHKNIEKELLEEHKENVRLIFFRRHRVDIGTEDLKEQNHEIIYFLGLQYLDKNNNNQKILFQIDKDGNFIVGS